MKIVFFGTSEFAVPILERLNESSYRPALVATNPDALAGRSQELRQTPVKKAVIRLGLPLVQPPQLTEVHFSLFMQSDLFIVAAYGKILPEGMLELPRFGSLNVHPSLLPRWRGPSPIQYAIWHGDEEIGVTIILMDEKVDHGPIIKNSKLKIPRPRQGEAAGGQDSKLTTPELTRILAEQGAELLLETIPEWLTGKIMPVPQDETRATYAKILKREDGRINWLRSAVEIERMVRAFQPWPGAYTFWAQDGNKVRLAIEEADVLEAAGGAAEQPGAVSAATGGFSVSTGSGGLLVKKLKPEGRSSMSAEDFLRGHRKISGSLLA